MTTQFISKDTIKTFLQGSLGAMSFGAYHQYTTNKLMDLNNELQETKQKYYMDEMKQLHKQEIAEIKQEHKLEIDMFNEKLKNIEKKLDGGESKKGWW